jgi:Uma2 family endonuclease
MSVHRSQRKARLALGSDDAGRRLTAEEFADADYDEPWKYEREDGRLAVMAPDGKDHVVTSSPWLERLIVYRLNHPGVVERVVPNAWVRVDDGTDRIGDIGVYLVHDPPALEIPDQAPELMFEVVSPGTEARKRDYVKKRADYHRLGIREYVVVDRMWKQVTVFTHAPEGYRERVLTPADTYATPLLPGLEIPLNEVWNR